MSKLNPIRVLDCFAGIGGFSYAGKLVGGFTTTGFIECESYCQKILAQHWPSVPIASDIRAYKGTYGEADLITAGFPCQDLSTAGKLAGLQGERSGLFYEVIRLAREIRPQFLLLENVANLASHQNGETFQEVLYQIAKAGFDAEWAVIPASDVGACHRRQRMWIVAYANKVRLQAPWAEQQTARFKQHRELGAKQLHSNWRRYVSKPVLCRGDDGLSNRLDRLKALGNSIVPQCAVIPMQRIKELAAIEDS